MGEKDNLSLLGKVAIVTGASRGIGREIALALAEMGADVGIAARTETESGDLSGTIHTTAAEIRKLGRRVVAVKADVSQEQDVQAVIDTVIRELGGIDILVNNAAAIFPSTYKTPLIDYPVEHWDLTMAVNLRGPFLCIKSAVPSMIRRGGGSIINITSIAAIRASKGRMAYGISKAGLDRMSFALAEELREYNIAVNSLGPTGLTETETARKLFLEHAPKHWIQPADVARAVAWLARQNVQAFTGRALAVVPGGKFVVIYGMRGGGEKMLAEID